jgi:hypothetical protein
MVGLQMAGCPERVQVMSKSEKPGRRSTAAWVMGKIGVRRSLIVSPRYYETRTAGSGACRSEHWLKSGAPRAIASLQLQQTYRKNPPNPSLRSQLWIPATPASRQCHSISNLMDPDGSEER